MPELEIDRKRFKFHERSSWESRLDESLSKNSFDIVAHAEKGPFFFQMFRDGGKDCLLQCKANGYQLEAALPEISGVQAREWLDLYYRGDERFEKAIVWKKTKLSRLTEGEKAFYRKLSWGKSKLIALAGGLIGLGSLYLTGQQGLLARAPQLKFLIPVGYLIAVVLLVYDLRWQRIHEKKLGIPFSIHNYRGVAIILLFLYLAILSLLPEPGWFAHRSIMERRRRQGQTIYPYQPEQWSKF